MVIARKGNQEVMIPLESYEVYYKNSGWIMVKDLAKVEKKEDLKDGFNKEGKEFKPEMVKDKEDFRERSNRNNKRK